MHLNVRDDRRKTLRCTDILFYIIWPCLETPAQNVRDEIPKGTQVGPQMGPQTELQWDPEWAPHGTFSALALQACSSTLPSTPAPISPPWLGTWAHGAMGPLAHGPMGK